MLLTDVDAVHVAPTGRPTSARRAAGTPRRPRGHHRPSHGASVVSTDAVRDRARMAAARGDDAGSMAPSPASDHDPLRVVVAGAGVGGLETMVALRGLVGHRVARRSSRPGRVHRARARGVRAVRPGSAQRYPVAALAADLDVTFVHDAVARVEHDDRVVRLQSGDELVYDRLVLAVGAFPYPAYAHGVCFTRPHDEEGFDEVVADLRDGVAEPSRSSSARGARGRYRPTNWRSWWPLSPPREQLTLVTPEHEPLSAFGPPPPSWMRAALGTPPASSCSPASRRPCRIRRSCRSRTARA